MQDQHTYPLSDFTSHTQEHLARLKATGEPETLTLDGDAAVVIQDSTSYQRLLERLDSLEAVAAVRESVAEYGRGEGRTAEKGFNALRGKHGIPRRT